jgi:hypothetical protein
MATLGEIIITANRPSVAPDVVPSDLITADDFYLERIELITSNQTISLANIMVELSYFEDIMNNAVTGELLINDAQNIIDRLQLAGCEYVRMKFKKTKQSQEEIFKYFRVFRVSERLLDTNYTELYKLQFCSEELFLSEQKLVSKSYPGKEISFIVKDILSSAMKVPKGKLYIQPTKGVYDFIVPNKKPFEAINWLANYAQPTDALGADYLFFENKHGFNFQSLQGLYSQKVYRKYNFGIRNASSSQNTSEATSAIYGIKSYTFLDTFDSLYGTSTGMFSNSVLTIDPLTRSYSTTNYNYLENFKKYKHLNAHPVLPESKNRDNVSANENYSSVLKVLTTNAKQKTAEGIRGVEGAVSNDVGVEVFVPHRTAQMAMAHYSRIKLSVPGDPALTVGQVIHITLPSVKNKDGSSLQQGQIDEVHSGKYLITAVRHIIDAYLKYETVLEVAKESLPTKLANFNSTDAQKLQQAVTADIQ